MWRFFWCYVVEFGLFCLCCSCFCVCVIVCSFGFGVLLVGVFCGSFLVCWWGFTGVPRVCLVVGGPLLCTQRGWLGGEPFLCLKLGVCVGGPSCASHLVCVCGGGPSCASKLVCAWGALLVPQTWRVCGGAFLCLQFGVWLGGRACSLNLGCVWWALSSP